jgi:hypothetical protein
MAALAVGLAGVGVAGGRLSAVWAAGAVQGDQLADGLLGLAAHTPYCCPVRTAKVRHSSRTGQAAQMAMAAWMPWSVSAKRALLRAAEDGDAGGGLPVNRSHR